MQKYIIQLAVIFSLLMSSIVVHVASAAEGDSLVEKLKKKYAADIAASVERDIPIVLSSDVSSAEKYYQDALKYAEGKDGITQNLSEAKRLYLLAAEAGHVAAQVDVGANFLMGDKGFPKDDKKALVWIDKAVGAGSVIAKALLLGCYIDGKGGLKKDRKIMAQLDQEIRKEDPTGEAILQLAHTYYVASFVNRNYKVKLEDVRELFLLAAERGDSWAQMRLSFMYDKPLIFAGVFEYDKNKAIHWAKQAARQGYQSAAVYLKEGYGITVFSDDGLGAVPELIDCPSTPYNELVQENKLDSGRIFFKDWETFIEGKVACVYEGGNSLNMGWSIYKDPLNKAVQAPCGYNDPYRPQELRSYVDEKKRSISLYSNKASAHVLVNLSRKEFFKNQQEWLDRAKQLLVMAEGRGTTCEAATLPVGVDNDATRLRQESKNQGPRAIME